MTTTQAAPTRTLEIRQQRAVQPHRDPAVREDLRRALHQHGRARDHGGPVRPARLVAAAGRAGARRGQRHRRRRVPPGAGLRRQGDRDRPGRGDGRHRPRAGRAARAGRLGQVPAGRRARDGFPRAVRHHLEPGRVHAHPRQAAAVLPAVFADGARRPAGDHRLRPRQDAGLARVRGATSRRPATASSSRSNTASCSRPPGSWTSSWTTPPPSSSRSSGPRRIAWSTSRAEFLASFSEADLNYLVDRWDDEDRLLPGRRHEVGHLPGDKQA